MLVQSRKEAALFSCASGWDAVPQPSLYVVLSGTVLGDSQLWPSEAECRVAWKMFVLCSES